MNLTQLRYVVEVAKTGSITKAAKNLYMGQPNLSKAIRELEDETNLTIFRRTRQGAEPTEQGARFLAYARSILAQVDELESLYQPQPERELRFSVSVPRATYVTVAFTDFLNQLPQDVPYQVSFKETSSLAALTDVAEGDSELAIVRLPVAHEEYYQGLLRERQLAWEELWEFRMSLLMSRTHPLASCNEIPYHMLDGYIEVAHGDVPMPTLSADQLRREDRMREHKRRIYVYERGSQYNLLRRVPGTYMWVSPIPIEILAENGLVLKECPVSTMRSKDLLVYREGHVLTAQEKNFLALVKRYTQNILQ